MGNDSAFGRVCYSQCGEDTILSFVFNLLKVSQPTYLEIGAFHPVQLSNTYLFYRQGSTGVCVEPNPKLLEPFKRIRPRDICCHAGCAKDSKQKAEFYVMDPSFLSTFSAEEAKRYSKYPNHRIECIIDVPLLNVNEIIEMTLRREPDIISIDVEGLDLEIVQSFDFTRFRPTAFCVETLNYAPDGIERKSEEIGKLLTGRGYMQYADTYINTIFVAEEKWRSRNSPKPN
jgi:FkbM family methyltransferase